MPNSVRKMVILTYQFTVLIDYLTMTHLFFFVNNVLFQLYYMRYEPSVIVVGILDRRRTIEEE